MLTILIKKIELTKSTIPRDIPEEIAPKGLSLERRWYLHDKIRDFCAEEYKDAVCPHPSQDLQSNSPQAPPCGNDDNPPPNKKRRVCGNCGLSGHNKRACPTSGTSSS